MFAKQTLARPAGQTTPPDRQTQSSDAHQIQLDDNQRAQDVRRTVLDEQQAPLDHPNECERTCDHSGPASSPEERARALRLRAVAALARAEQAHQAYTA